MNDFKKGLAGFVAMALPAVIFAADGIDGLFDTIGALIGKAQLLIVGLVSLVFFYGLFKFVFGSAGGGGDDKKVAKGFMIWSIVAIFLMASIWGIVRILQQTVGVENENQPHVPVWEYNNN